MGIQLRGGKTNIDMVVMKHEKLSIPDLRFDSFCLIEMMIEFLLLEAI